MTYVKRANLVLAFLAVATIVQAQEKTMAQAQAAAAGAVSAAQQCSSSRDNAISASTTASAEGAMVQPSKSGWTAAMITQYTGYINLGTSEMNLGNQKFQDALGAQAFGNGSLSAANASFMSGDYTAAYNSYSSAAAQYSSAAYSYSLAATAYDFAYNYWHQANVYWDNN